MLKTIYKNIDDINIFLFKYLGIPFIYDYNSDIKKKTFVELAIYKIELVN